MPSLKLIHSYISNRKQRVRINNSYSSWSEILFGVPQGSILGPLLFNIFLCDLFLFVPNINIASYADDTTPYCTGKDVMTVLSNLEQAADTLSVWFKNNSMKANADKYHVLLSENKKYCVKVENTTIATTKCETLLGIKLDNKLTFQTHVESLCKKASQKLNALARISSLISLEQRKLLFNAFIRSQFSYCPLVWMLHSKKLNHRINRIHERALRTVYKDYDSSFENLLLKDNSLTTHQRNLQILATEIYKVKSGIAPEIMSEVFSIVDNPYNLRNNVKFKSKNIHTVRYGTETLSFIGPKIWTEVPDKCKTANSLKDFKVSIKSWIPDNCPCKICRVYVQNLGYL